MATWIKINSSTHKQVPDGTIGVLLKQTTNYYFIQHWALNKTIQELKTNCSIHDSIIGNNYTYSSSKLPCTNFKVVGYAEDYDSGEQSYSQLTGLRVVVEPVNKTGAFRDHIEQSLIIKVSDLDNC